MSRSVRSNTVRLRGLVASCAALVLLVFPLAAGAQTPTEHSTTQNVSSAPPDFMLGRPRVMIGARGSVFMANANSDLK